jgi:hypothetical protein
LQLEKGFIALASGDNVYFVPMLMRYAGFVEGIKEGAKVSVEGYQFRDILHPKKVTVNGKDYDFPRPSVKAYGPKAPNIRSGGFGRGNGFKQGQKHTPMNKHGGSRGKRLAANNTHTQPNLNL